jgi:hypothetical protein
MGPLTKGWRIGFITLIIAAPFYAWLWISMAYHMFPPFPWPPIIFLVYLFVGYFVLKAVLKRLNRNK